jgi:hypothetical protein
MQEISAEIVAQVVIHEEMRLRQAVDVIVIVERILKKYGVLDTPSEKMAFHDMCWEKFGRSMKEVEVGT